MSMLSALIASYAHRIATGTVDGLVATGKLAARLTPDALALTGAGLVSYGASLVYFPAGFIVAGLLALAAGVLGAINAKRSNTEKVDG